MRLRTASNQQQQKSLAEVTAANMSIAEEPKEEADLQSTETLAVCYCGAERRLGDLEVHCAGCKRWFHQTCFRDLKDFGGLPFMVSYVFNCQNCSPDGVEKWNIKSATFSHMCVMALANMTLEHRLKNTSATDREQSELVKYFGVEEEIIPYMEKNWEYLSTTARRQKKTWHQTIVRTLQAGTELFLSDPKNSIDQQEGADSAQRWGAFALHEQDLLRIGPMHESILQLSKRSSSSGAPSAAEKELLALGAEPGMAVQIDVTTIGVIEGPKTRGASKRKAAAVAASNSGGVAASAVTSGHGSGGEGKAGTPVNQLASCLSGPVSKKSRNVACEFSSVQVMGTTDGQAGVFIDFPFNREGYRYYLVEKDPNIVNRDKFDTEEVNNTRAVQIPSHIFRIVIQPVVTLSPNDRAHQLIVENDNLTVTGNEGYSLVRASHSVSHGKWYYEMEFLAQPGDSHVRVGWAQSYAVLQACLGYGKFGYSFRSKHGTAFHDGYGRRYFSGGFKQGDTVGCLIELPTLEECIGLGFSASEVLPASKKDCDLIKFKQTCFFEEKEDSQQALLQQLRPLKGSKISFFVNGKPCGTAFEDVHFGHYFPAVALFHSAQVRLNFGPNFRATPDCLTNGQTQPMCVLTKERQVEQTMADLVYISTNAEELERRNSEYFAALAAKDGAANGNSQKVTFRVQSQTL